MAAYFGLVPWVVFLPVIGLLLNLLVGKRLGEKGIGLIASLATGLAFVVSVILALGLGSNPQPVTIHLADWLVVGSLNAAWNFRVDTLSVTMMLVVSGVGTLIHIYATGYMHSDVRHNGDPQRYRRFFVFFNLFIVAMMILVSADNYLMLFVGWEGVGLCSYLLIGFWFEKGQDGLGNARAAKKAFVVTRIGDFGVLVALFFIFWAFGSFNFDVVFSKAAAVSQALPAVTLAITLFLLLGVAGKSAQLPLYVWLPDAMAGPTPVSALIHAATMVTAGVYLIARSSPLFNMVPAAQQTVAWVGALTAFFAATIAVGQSDIKKVLAYSTISQLGYMVAAVGMGAYVAGMFHLVTHAFFKALLFLAAGSVILGMERGEAALDGSDGRHGQNSGAEMDPQDMRNMGGLQSRMPLTFWVYLGGALALSGIAPLAGFFSKDEILAAANAGHMTAIFILLVLSAFLTAFYMGRQILMVFFGKPRSQPAARATESPAIITGPLVALAVLSVVGGALNLPGLAWLEQWLLHTVQNVLPGNFTWPVALGSLAVALLGLVVAWLVYGRRSLGSPASPDPLELSLKGLFRAVEHKWWVDEAYHVIFVHPYELLTRFLSQPVDLGVIDGAANGLATLSRRLARAWSRLENGFVRSYALAIAIGLVLILGYLVLR
jgi:NADH-quinone oxidoreductase subunit L